MVDSRATRVLRQHLDTERLLGVEAVPVDVAAMAAAAQARAAQATQAAGTQAGAARPQAPWTPPVRGGQGGPGGQSGQGGARPARPAANAPRASQAPRAQGHPAAARTTPLAALPEVSRPDLVAGDAAASLRVLDEQAVRSCTACHLHGGRTQTVFGSGDAHAALMIVGDGPSAEDDHAGQPFMGPAGELLDKQLKAMGLERSGVYLANVVKCRPPDSRAPKADEAAACGAYLKRQIQIVGPRVILTVGGPAAKLVLGVTQNITQVRGQWHRYDGPGGPIPVMPTFDPAYLTRAYTTENRRRVWDDLQAVLARLADEG